MTARAVRFREGGGLETHTIVTTIGNAPNPLVLDLCRQLGLEPAKGRIPTDEFMRVSGQQQLWAAGDGAAVPWDDRGTRKVAPPTAQLAVQEGIQLGRNLGAALRGAPGKPFHYRYRGQLATIGHHAAVAEIYGLHFRGFLAWWMWRTIYLAKLPTIRRRLRVTIDWTFELIFARDISVLLPRPDEVMRSIHLEAGEVLVSAGDPCRSYFYVRSGALTVDRGHPPEQTIVQGGIIDDALVENQAWQATLCASKPTDLVVFRGAAFRLLEHDLKLVARAAAS
jgi:NADH dehydrogenase